MHIQTAPKSGLLQAKVYLFAGTLLYAHKCTCDNKRSPLENSMTSVARGHWAQGHGQSSAASDPFGNQSGYKQTSTYLGFSLIFLEQSPC